uniref:F-box associated domain-containing protein n=1 Tax=Leersia perrieri TaxID=77586 RepID=A0A0D9W3P0_9ORYZ
MIWVSTDVGHTYSFDTARRGWSKQKGWALSFIGRADCRGGHSPCVADYKLWFVFNDAGHVCTFDLAANYSSPPPPRDTWLEEVKTPKEWKQVTSYLVHLGSGRFCVARIFCDIKKDTEKYGVFTSVEVEKAGGGLRMVKHRSECYRMDDILQQWVL